MTKKLPKRGLPPMHPGELLREEILPTLDRSKAEIARLLGVSRQTLYDVLKEKQPVTPVMALRLGKLCGNGPDLWLNLQKRYDLDQAERELGEEIKSSRRWRSPELRGRYSESCRDRLRKARASGPHIRIITTAQEAKPTKASMTVRAISMACA